MQLGELEALVVPGIKENLVSMVLTKGGHIAERSKSSEIWKDIYQTLFEQDLFAPLKEHYYDLKECGGIRLQDEECGGMIRLHLSKKSSHLL